MKFILALMIGGIAAFGRSQACADMLMWAQGMQAGQQELAQGARFRADDDSFASQVARAALDQVGKVTRYDDSYVKIAFPNGDVPAHTGNNADLIVRLFRTVGVDLQSKVYIDMLHNISTYPDHAGRSQPDPSIDHRRAANLRAFFSHCASSLSCSKNSDDYEPGDIITCRQSDGTTHIAVVVPAPGGGRPWIVHNVNAGPRIEDRLFDMPLTGHYRYRPRA